MPDHNRRCADYADRFLKKFLENNHLPFECVHSNAGRAGSGLTINKGDRGKVTALSDDFQWLGVP